MNKQIEFIDGKLYVDGKAKYCPFGNFKQCYRGCACLNYESREINLGPATCEARCGDGLGSSCPAYFSNKDGWGCAAHDEPMPVKAITVRTCHNNFMAIVSSDWMLFTTTATGEASCPERCE